MERALVDTNSLLRSDLFDTPIQPLTVSFTELAAEYQLCICMQNLVEYWAVVTRPKNENGYQVAIEDAWNRMQILKETFEILPDRAEAIAIWETLCKSYSVIGRRTHDARLAATALANGVDQLVTLNHSDFKQFKEISIISGTTAG